jgi:hypothetical protein
MHGQIKLKKDNPRKFIVGQSQSKRPAKLGIRVMTEKDKLSTGRRVGSRKGATGRGAQPYNRASGNSPNRVIR